MITWWPKTFEMFCDVNSQSSLVIQLHLDRGETLTTVNTSATYREVGSVPQTPGGQGEFAHTVTTTTNFYRTPSTNDSAFSNSTEKRISTSVSCNEHLSVHGESHLNGSANRYTSDPFVFDNSGFSPSTSRQPEFHQHMGFDQYGRRQKPERNGIESSTSSFHPSLGTSTIEMPSGNISPTESTPFLQEEMPNYAEHQPNEGVMGPFVAEARHFHPLAQRAQSQPLIVRNLEVFNEGRQQVCEVPTAYNLPFAQPQLPDVGLIRQIERSAQTGSAATDGKAKNSDGQLGPSGSATQISTPFSQEIFDPWSHQKSFRSDGPTLDDDVNSVFTSELNFNQRRSYLESPLYHSVMSENDSVYYETAHGSTSPRPPSTLVDTKETSPLELNGNLEMDSEQAVGEMKFTSLDLHLSLQPQPDYPAAFKAEGESRLGYLISLARCFVYFICLPDCLLQRILFCFPQLRGEESETAETELLEGLKINSRPRSAENNAKSLGGGLIVLEIPLNFSQWLMMFCCKGPAGCVVVSLVVAESRGGGSRLVGSAGFPLQLTQLLAGWNAWIMQPTCNYY